MSRLESTAPVGAVDAEELLYFDKSTWIFKVIAGEAKYTPCPTY